MKNLKRISKNLSWLASNPIFLVKLLKNYLNMVVFRKNILRSVEIALSYKCQFKCQHCSCENIKINGREEVTLEEIKDSINQCTRLGALHFLITGGEPLLDDKLYDVIKYIKKKDCFSSIDTNGYLLDENRIKKLKICGVNLIEISLDSHIPSEHDKFRGMKGSFNKAIEAIKLCKEHKIPCVISTLVTKEKIKNRNIPKIINLAKKMEIQINFCYPVPTGRWSKNYKEILNKSDWEEVKKFQENPFVRSCEQNNYLSKGCSAGKEKIGITAYGDVIPCPLIQVSFGNVREEPISKIWKSMHNNKYFCGKNSGNPCLPASNKQFIDKYIGVGNKKSPKIIGKRND